MTLEELEKDIESKVRMLEEKRVANQERLRRSLARPNFTEDESIENVVEDAPVSDIELKNELEQEIDNEVKESPAINLPTNEADT